MSEIPEATRSDVGKNGAGAVAPAARNAEDGRPLSVRIWTSRDLDPEQLREACSRRGLAAPSTEELHECLRTVGELWLEDMGRSAPVRCVLRIPSTGHECVIPPSQWFGWRVPGGELELHTDGLARQWLRDHSHDAPAAQAALVMRHVTDVEAWEARVISAVSCMPGVASVRLVP